MIPSKLERRGRGGRRGCSSTAPSSPGLRRAAPARAPRAASPAAPTRRPATSTAAAAPRAPAAARVARVGGFALLAVIVLGLAVAGPFLGGASNLMSLVIIGIALYEAWKINRRVKVSGRFRAGVARPPAAASP